MTTNPGLVPPDAGPLPSDTDGVDRRCFKCGDAYKPPRAHHDSVTGRCIVKFDHYCPWVNNSVGVRNHKHFLLFIGYTAAASAGSMLLVFLSIVNCADEQVGGGEVEGPCGLVFGGAAMPTLLVVTVIFFAFTTCMLYDQHDIMCGSGASKIGRMKMMGGVGPPAQRNGKIFGSPESRERRAAARSSGGGRRRIGQAQKENGGTYGPAVTHVHETFGGDSNKMAWHWFVPTQVRYPNESDLETILGFTVLAPTEKDGEDVSAEEEGMGEENPTWENGLSVPSLT